MDTDLVSIGEAARMLGLAPSALRYYEQRGLVSPSGRRGGRRVYSPSELRALAFIKIASELGLPLEAAGALLDSPRAHWRAVVSDQIHELQALIARAQATHRFLAHALECPADHPVRECPVLISVLDRVLDGTSAVDLVAESQPARTSGPVPHRPAGSS